MPTYAEALYSLPTDTLRAIVHNRDLELSKLAHFGNKRSFVQHIAGELTKHGPTLSAIAKCNARELRLLQLVAAADSGRGVAWKTLVSLAGGEAAEAALDEVMAGLEELGLAIRAGDLVIIPDSVRRSTPVSLTDRYTMAGMLGSYDAPALRRIVNNLGLEEERSTKAASIDAICNYLLAAMPGLRFNPPLTKDELEVLEFLMQRGGSATPMETAEAVLTAAADDFFRYEWQNRWKMGRERNAIDTLLARGIIFVASSGYGYNYYLVIPGDAMLALSGAQACAFWTDPPPAPTELEARPPLMGAVTSLIRDAVSMLSFFAVQSAARTNTGHIHKGSLKAVTRLLQRQSEEYATFLYCILRDGGLVEPQGEKGNYGINALGIRWLHSAPEVQAAHLFAAWRRGTTYSEMYEDPLARANEHRPSALTISAREAVLALVAEVGATSGFIDINSIVSTLMFRAPLLLSQPAAAYLEVVSIKALVFHILADTLVWLGLAESGAEPGESAEAGGRQYVIITGYRLTQRGAELIAGAPAADTQHPRESKFVVQANAEVIVPPFLDTWLLYRLMTFAETPAKGPPTSTFQITRESLRRALDLGASAGQILAFLAENSRTGVPQNVEYLINEVGGKHGHIRVGQCEMYLRVDSPALLKELQSHRDLKACFVRALDDRVALLKGDDIDKVLKQIRKAGYLPVSDEAGASSGISESGANVAPLELRKSPAPAAAGRRGDKSKDDVDWRQISLDDDKPWDNQLALPVQDISKPRGACDNPSLIRVLLHNACIQRNIVELVCKLPGQQAERILFEPLTLKGDIVTGFNRHSNQPLLLNIDSIHWARLTPHQHT